MLDRDFLIVGQGLAGSVLAYLLWKEGKKVTIIDKSACQAKSGGMTSSKIAAGIINPITGRRFVKSWRIDDFLPKAQQFYTELEQLLAIKLWHERPLFRILNSVEEENNWLLRKSYPEYQAYCGETTPSVSALEKDVLKPVHAFAEIKQAAQVNIPILVSRMRYFFDDLDMFIEAEFDFSKMVVEDDFVIYNDIRAEKVIFTEGAEGGQNDYFGWLPFNLDKGELLLIKMANWDFDGIIKDKISIVPLYDTEGGEKGLCWAGATNAWNFENNQPTENNKQLIINELEQMLNVPYEIVAHRAAIRPTVKDRRPFIGLHPNFPTLGIFNGFGTKGVSLIPYWAEHYKEYLLNNTLLDKAVDISRFD